MRAGVVIPATGEAYLYRPESRIIGSQSDERPVPLAALSASWASPRKVDVNLKASGQTESISMDRAAAISTFCMVKTQVDSNLDRDGTEKLALC